MFPGDPGALLSGILYGDRGLSQQANAAFRASGMTHLIAVSGSNIAIVVSLFVPVLLLFGYRRPWAILLSGIGIILFTLFVGADASVIRAAIMGWLAILARVFGRRPSAARLLLIAGSVMAFCDPYALIYDAGFALSFLATWGLIAWARPIADGLPFIPKTFGLSEMISTTLAATLATFPYSSWAFGSLSIAGLLTNVFAIPLTAFVMLWGTIAILFGGVLPWIMLPAQGGLALLLRIADIGSSYPALQIGWRMPWWACATCYLAGFLSWRYAIGRMRMSTETRVDIWSHVDNEGLSTKHVTSMWRSPSKK
jgi:competence protein ComEC